MAKMEADLIFSFFVKAMMFGMDNSAGIEQSEN